MQHIFLSPHLDDAVASCGGTIARKVYEREDVLVVTVYTKNQNLSKIPNKFHKFAIYDIRKEEDKKALDKLSANYLWMDLVERAYSLPLPKRPTDVFKINLLKGIEQFKNIHIISKEIDKLLEKYPKAHIYSPLGIGNHYDHVEVFLSSLMYMVDYSLFEKFHFYLDFYGVISTKMRKKHYLGKTITNQGFKKPENSSFRFFMMTNVINSMIKGNNFESLLKPRYLDLDWKLETLSIKGYENLKLKALEQYESQVKLFGYKQTEKVLDTFHRNWNSSELYLRVSEF